MGDLKGADRDWCEGCGACCLHVSLPLYDEGERHILAATAPGVYADFEAAQETRRLQLAVVGTDFIPCLFFDPLTRLCRHYEHRPVVCEQFDPGCPECIEFRRDAGTLLKKVPGEK